MSADNIIVVAKTDDGFFVKHCGFSRYSELSRDEKEKYIREENKSIENEDRALAVAKQMLGSMTIVEYGIEYVDFTA